MNKTIYDKVVRQPRLFEDEELYKQRKQETEIDEAAKYKMYMDRAFLELEKVNKELQQTRIELQNATKQYSGKDELIINLNQKITEQQLTQQMKLQQLQDAQNEELIEKQKELEQMYKSKQEALEELGKRPITIDSKQLLENSALLTEDAKNILYDSARSKIAQQQLKIIQELYKTENSIFPTNVEDITTKIQIQNKFLNEMDDFCQADQAEITEVIRNYYRIKDLEMELIVQNEIINKVQEITGIQINSSELKENNSGLILDDDDNLEVSLIEHGKRRN